MTTKGWDDLCQELPVSLHQLENTAQGASVDTDVYHRSGISHLLGMMLAYSAAPVRVGRYLG